MSVQRPDTIHQPSAPISRTMIELPSGNGCDAAVTEILNRGNIPLLVGDKILAEIANAELNEGLKATGSLNSAELVTISSALVENISDALDTGGEACDLAEVAADAAALFVLCLRRSNVLDVDNLPTCSVSFSQEGNEAQLILAG